MTHRVQRRGAMAFAAARNPLSLVWARCAPVQPGNKKHGRSRVFHLIKNGWMSGLAARSGFAATRRLGAFFDVVDHVADGLQFFSIFVWHFDGKFLFERHHQFHDIERIGAQVLDKRRLRRNLLRIYSELLDDDVLDLFLDRFLSHKNFLGWSATLTPHAAAPQVKELAKIAQPNSTTRWFYWPLGVEQHSWLMRLLNSTN